MKKVYKNKLPKNSDLRIENVNLLIENGELLVKVEFKENFEPKDGDFCVSSLGNVFIYCDKELLSSDSYCGCYCVSYSVKGQIITYYTKLHTKKNGCRYATPEEKDNFLERLEKECRKKWNAEKKCLEDIYVPKFGDIVRIEHPDCIIYKRDYVIGIFPDKKTPNRNESGFFDIAFIDMEGDLSIDRAALYNYGHVYPATEEEKQELFSKLAEIGKRWNPETKQLEDIRWRAKIGENYYVVNMFGTVQKLVEGGLCKDEVYYNIGNYFKTSKAACRFTKQVQELFKNSKAE